MLETCFILQTAEVQVKYLPACYYFSMHILLHAFDNINSINLINYMLCLVFLLPNECWWSVQRKRAAIQNIYLDLISGLISSSDF